MRIKFFYVYLAVFVFLLFNFVFWLYLNYAVLSINNNYLIVKRAQTYEKQVAGLSYVKDVKTGIIFTFKTKKIKSLQFKQTYSDLDILFCSDNKVIQLENSKAFQKNIITAVSPIDFIVELPEGCISKYDIKLNDFVNFY